MSILIESQFDLIILRKKYKGANSDISILEKKPHIFRNSLYKVGINRATEIIT